MYSVNTAFCPNIPCVFCIFKLIVINYIFQINKARLNWKSRQSDVEKQYTLFEKRIGFNFISQFKQNGNKKNFLYFLALSIQDIGNGSLNDVSAGSFTHCKV